MFRPRHASWLCPVRAGKLFPGPHLYAGAAITVLWALSAALVPAMQKGNDSARTAHIALNCVNLLLFASQVNDGARAAHSFPLLALESCSSASASAVAAPPRTAGTT